MGNLLSLGLFGLIAATYFNQPPDATPQQRLEAMQVQVNKAAAEATPHVLGMAEVVKRQVEKVKAENAAVQTSRHTATPAVQTTGQARAPAEAVVAAEHVETWQDRTSAKYCYPTGHSDNVACFSQPHN